MTNQLSSTVQDVIQVTHPKFVFEHQGNEIVWVLHLFTGVKTLYVNGELYKRDYSVWCRSGRYQITIGDAHYKLRIMQDSDQLLDFKEFNAPLVAQLSCDDIEVESRRHKFSREDVTKHFVFSLAAGLLIGFSLSAIL